MTTKMKKVTGIGGVFFKANDPAKLRDWYRQHLGIDSNDNGAADFQWRETETDRIGRTVWSAFPHDTSYFDPSEKQFMINYRVANLDALQTALRSAGGAADDRIEEYDY